MKRVVMLCLCLLLLGGCLPTPEVEVIPNKGEQKDWQVEAKPYVPEEETSSKPSSLLPFIYTTMRLPSSLLKV